MIRSPDVGTRAVRALGAVASLASCLPMLVMLPAGFTGALALVGVEAGRGPFATVGRELAPVARPLLLASTALVTVGGLRCSRATAALAAAGGGGLYLSMYVWTRPDGTTAPLLFYLGLALLLGTFLVAWLRPRRATCRPVVGRRAGARLAAATLAASLAVVGAAAAVDFGGAPATVTAPGGTSMSAMSAMGVAQQRAPVVAIGRGRFSWDVMLARLTGKRSYRVRMGERVRLRVRGLFPDGTVAVRVEDGGGRTVFSRTYSRANEPTGSVHTVSGRPGRWSFALTFSRAGGGPFRIDAAS